MTNKEKIEVLNTLIATAKDLTELLKAEPKMKVSENKRILQERCGENELVVVELANKFGF